MAGVSIDTPATAGVRAETGHIDHPVIKGIVLIASQCLPVMAVVALLPVIPKLFQQFGGVPNAGLLVPMIITIPSLCVALSAPWAGWLADRIGRRRTLNISFGLYVVAALAPLLLSSITLIIISRALVGVAEAGVVTSSGALTADYYGSNRKKWLAWQSVANSVCGTALLALGGALADVSWQAPFAIYLVTIPFFILSLIYITEPTRAVHVTTQEKTIPFSWRAGLLVAAVTLVSSVLYYVEPLHMARILEATGVKSHTETGIILALTSLGYIVGSFIYKALADKQIHLQLAAAGGAIGAGMIGIGFSSAPMPAAFFAALQQIGAGMIIPILLGWGQGVVPFQHRGRIIGFWATAFFVGMFLCSPMTFAVETAMGGLQPAVATLGLVSVILSLGTFVAGFRYKTCTPSR
ncbi:MFS family permease [Agrobacterium vitis]|nr:MFS family permease [Agrobacterium vitis]MBE1439436.1 MFS family permease [Agrobacterium vitis]